MLLVGELPVPAAMLRLPGFDSKGSFKIKSAATDADGAGTGGSPFTTPILMILGAFVIAGATLSQFVSRNPNSR